MRVLVTGGAGSIGSEVVKWLRADGDTVRVMDNHEEGLWSLKLSMPDLDVRLGDICSYQDLGEAADGVDAIVHCAALKHVGFCESNPRMSHEVNCLGTLSVVNAANGRRVVFLSTDKAIDPVCRMGKDKAEAERYLLRWCPEVKIVRFGNVIGSRGSILPAVERYYKLGLPIPITDPEMTRFFMPVTEAVIIIKRALSDQTDQRVFTTDNPRSARIGKFIAVCRALLCPAHPVEVVGARPGERLHERLVLNDGSLVQSDDEGCLMHHVDMVHLVEGSRNSRRCVA